jgi:lipoprotein-anchoring transpeptidase ErfK/SrfK
MFFKNPGLAILASNFERSLSIGLVGALCSFSFWSVPAQAQDAEAQTTDVAVSPLADPNRERDASPPDNSQWVESWANDLKQSSQQWIQIDISDQRLIAWEGNTPVFSITVSTGRASDMTPTGVYAIENKFRTARMQGENYDIPDVPYTMYFSGSYAIHGAYWHTNFGSPVSSGCINVPVQSAAWLYDWANMGTAVVVQN